MDWFTYLGLMAAFAMVVQVGLRSAPTTGSVLFATHGIFVGVATLFELLSGEWVPLAVVAVALLGWLTPARRARHADTFIVSRNEPRRAA